MPNLTLSIKRLLTGEDVLLTLDKESSKTYLILPHISLHLASLSTKYLSAFVSRLSPSVLATHGQYKPSTLNLKHDILHT